MVNTITKAQRAFVQGAARQLLKAQKIDVTDQVDVAVLGKELSSQLSISRERAEAAIIHAVLVKRHEGHTE